MTNQLTQRVSIVWFLSIVALAPLGVGAGGCGPHAVVGAECRQDAGPDSPQCACERNGKDFAAGKTFPAGDGCNLCACREDGSTRCTEIICGKNSSDGGGGVGGSAGDAGTTGGGAKTCGGLLPANCTGDEYCNFAADAHCGAADATGTCETKPDACTRDYKPVCGCDGKTYSNACTAASNGVSVQSQHECMQP